MQQLGAILLAVGLALLVLTASQWLMAQVGGTEGVMEGSLFLLAGGVCLVALGMSLWLWPRR